MPFEGIVSADSTTRAGGVTPYPGVMRRLIFVLVVVVAVRALLSYREKKLTAGEAELGLPD
jgi:hypothetical protein